MTLRRLSFNVCEHTVFNAEALRHYDNGFRDFVATKFPFELFLNGAADHLFGDGVLDQC